MPEQAVMPTRQHGRTPLPAKAAMLAATLVAVLLICSPAATPTEAKVVLLRVSNLTSLTGFEELSGVRTRTGCTAGSQTLQKGCFSGCLAYTGSVPGLPSCFSTVAPYCGMASNGQKMCSVEVELEAVMDTPGSTSADRVMKMMTIAHPTVGITKIDGPTYVAATASIPENRARWRYQVWTALATTSTMVTFTAVQGYNERSLNQIVELKCNAQPATWYPSVVVNPPTVNCTDGTIRANVSVSDCVKFGAQGYLSFYINVFDANVPTSIYDGRLVYTGEPMEAMNGAALASIYPEEKDGTVYAAPRMTVATGSGAPVEVVFRRARLTQTTTYPHAFAPWPAGVQGIRLGYRYVGHGQSRVPPDFSDNGADNVPRWFLTDKVFYSGATGCPTGR